MRTKHLWSILTLCLGVLSLTSCLDNDEEGRKVTDYKEWVLTVASKKVPGIVMHRGSYHAVEVYAVKKGPANEWSTYENIAGFEYEEGYEYQVKVSETTYLDDAMGDPSWTEHQLLEIIRDIQLKALFSNPETACVCHLPMLI